MISVCFQGKPFNFTVIQVYAPISNTEEAEVEQFYEDLKEILEKKKKQKTKNKKGAIFIIGDWKAKVGAKKHQEYTQIWTWGTE